VKFTPVARFEGIHSGIRNSDALHTLLRRKLIAPAGRAKTRGNPVLYRTTRRFLLHFGLTDLAQLLSIKELRPVLGTVLDPESD
jgi:segregation and condensation protein B